MWEIRDATGTLYQGDEPDMVKAWNVLISKSVDDYIKNMTEGFPEFDQITLEDNWKKWITDVEGDLELVEVHKIYSKELIS